MYRLTRIVLGLLTGVALGTPLLAAAHALGLPVHAN